MALRCNIIRSVLVLLFLLTGGFGAAAPASAADLDDHLWTHRPLLVFAPTDGDPRLAATVSRVEASRCEFEDRDMVLGRVVARGSSTLDREAVDAAESQRLRQRFAVGEDAFTVVLIGKDGGEKLRVNGVPDLRTFYAVIDGMPMRSREAGGDPSSC